MSTNRSIYNSIDELKYKNDQCSCKSVNIELALKINMFEFGLL